MNKQTNEERLYGYLKFSHKMDFIYILFSMPLIFISFILNSLTGGIIAILIAICFLDEAYWIYKTEKKLGLR